MKNYQKLQRKLKWKFIGEVLSYRGSVFVAETGFPIKENYDKKILQFIEAESMSKWGLYKHDFITHCQSSNN